MSGIIKAHWSQGHLKCLLSGTGFRNWQAVLRASLLRASSSVAPVEGRLTSLTRWAPVKGSQLCLSSASPGHPQGTWRYSPPLLKVVLPEILLLWDPSHTFCAFLLWSPHPLGVKFCWWWLTSVTSSLLHTKTNARESPAGSYCCPTRLHIIATYRFLYLPVSLKMEFVMFSLLSYCSVGFPGAEVERSQLKVPPSSYQYSKTYSPFCHSPSLHTRKPVCGLTKNYLWEAKLAYLVKMLTL